MKTFVLLTLLALPCFAQKDMQVVLTNCSISAWNRRPDNDDKFTKRDPNARDIQLKFTMTISTKEERAYPVNIFVFILVEAKDGSRKWIFTNSENITGLKWKKENYRYQELNAKEVTGTHKVIAGFRGVNGKIIAWSIKTISRYDEGKAAKYNPPIMLEWKDKTSKGIKNAPIPGSNLEEKTE